MPQYRVRQLFGLLLGCAFIVSPADAADSAPEPPPVRARLRADWANPSKSSWDGVIRVSDGRIQSVRTLELRTGQVSLVATDPQQEIRFRAEGPTDWCGLEFVVDAPPKATLELELDGHRLQTPLEDLLKGSTSRMAWEGSARLRRDPADILQVKLNRSHLIFAPGEPVKIDLAFNLLAVEPRVVDTQLHLELRSTCDRKRLFTLQDKLHVHTNAVDLTRQMVTIRTPVNEGAYDLVIRAEPDGGQPVERVVQFVVFDSTARPTPSSSELVTRLVHEIDPSWPAPDGPWYSTRRIKAQTTRLGHFLWSSVRHPFTARERAKESPVLMCRMNVENPGLAHLLNIEYEDSGEILLAASVFDHDADRRWVQLPMTSGVRTAEKLANAVVQSHQIAFWPQTNSPSLSLSLQSPTGIAAVKKIRLHELPQGLPTLDVAESVGQRRLFGLYLDNPDVWASWGSARAVEPSSKLSVDDWRTFLLSMNHLAEYARFAGYNCIQPTVVGQGGAMYPTTLLEANFRLDSGFVADSSPDPVRKDAVELLLRICQRNHLSVVPNIRFDGAISSLDRKLTEGDAQASGLLLVSREGKVWGQPVASNLSPVRRYNPLHPDVQAAMLEVVREFVQTYGLHPAFETMALDLAAHSHVVLPGLDWGYDDLTVADFIRETGAQSPPMANDDPTRFAQRFQWLTGPARDQWIAWRCRRLAKFYESVLAEVQVFRPTDRLIVGLTTLFGPSSDDPRDAARPTRLVEESLKARGIDLRNWNTPPGLIILRPFAATGASAEGLQLNASRELDELMANAGAAGRGSLCIHEPEILQVSSTAGGERLAESPSETMALPVVRPGRQNLKRFAQSLANSDCQAVFEGGASIPLGCESVQREFASVFRALPTSAFQPVETLQPVTVRSYRAPRDTFIYMVNDASYPVETSLSFNCTAQATLSNGSTGDRLAVHHTEQGLGTRLSLEPFQIVCLKLSGPDASVAQCDVKVPQAAESGLKVRIDRLEQAMKIMGRDSTRMLDGIPPNGDFELPADDDTVPAHWTAEGPESVCTADRRIFHGGESSLRLEGKAASVAECEKFDPPEGRTLAMNVWLRASRPNQRVRWFLVGNHDGDTIYRCYADVPLSTNWEQKQFRALNLPDGHLTDVQIKFQLLDEGAVWIDDARVCALPITQDEKLAITKSIAATVKAWKERRWSDFERLSDGYWPTYLIENVERSTVQTETAKDESSPM
jgi:hypothetical protein